MSKPTAAIRYQGTITRWDDARGFGFVAPNGGGAPVFIHVKALGGGARRPVSGDVVTFVVRPGTGGKLQAEQAVLVRSRASLTRQAGREQSSSALIVTALGFLGLLGLSVLAGKAHIAVFGVYLVLSVITYLRYGADKSAARMGRSRTAEKELLLLGLAGGWPGALIAQRTWRHKTSKQPFQNLFRLTVLLNCIALGCLQFASH